MVFFQKFSKFVIFAIFKLIAAKIKLIFFSSASRFLPVESSSFLSKIFQIILDTFFLILNTRIT